jgi:hypothetical protein
MRLTHLPEPELEFAEGGRHEDVRFGLWRHGPLDAVPGVLREIRVGLIGTPESVAAFQTWFRSCEGGVAAKRSTLPNLFLPFPALAVGGPLASRFVLEEDLTRKINPAALHTALKEPTQRRAAQGVSAQFLEEARYLVESKQPNVIVCAPPREVFDVLDGNASKRAPEQILDEANNTSPAETADAEPGEEDAPSSDIDFHDYLKAQCMQVGVPLQLVRPGTYGAEGSAREESSERRQTQDPATCAWNLHVALYYKAGGTPWRIADVAEYATCFVGIAFYRSADETELTTSMAQVFNTRGDGVVVRGAAARIEKSDRSPHLSRTDANSLVRAALRAYLLEHHTRPARIVVHKSSWFDEDEIAGSHAAATEEKIHSIDLLSFPSRMATRLFRRGYYPPLRGTLLHLDARNLRLYLKGSVPFYRTWPGMYVPRSTAIRLDQVQEDPVTLAKEILALSKLNWNNTQFDGAMPITVLAARKVGSILKHVPANAVVQGRYGFYM